MNKFLFILLLVPCLLTVEPVYSQVKDKDSLRQEYLRIWKNQRKLGQVLLGSGLFLVSIGFIVAASEVDTFVGPVMILLGGITTIISLPVLIYAGSNRRKAAQLSLAPESIRIPDMTMNNRKYAALKLIIPL